MLNQITPKFKPGDLVGIKVERPFFPYTELLEAGLGEKERAIGIIIKESKPLYENKPWNYYEVYVFAIFPIGHEPIIIADRLLERI